MVTRVTYNQKPLAGLIRVSQFNTQGRPSEYTLQLFHELRGMLPLVRSKFRTHGEAIAYASTHGFQPFGWSETVV